MDKMDIRFEWLRDSKAAYVHASGDSPEEAALAKIIAWANSKGINKQPNVSLLGRNTYPTNHPEPHGYEYYLAVSNDFVPEGEIEMKTLPGGMYAVLQFKNLFMMQDAWIRLIKWVEDNGHEPVGMYKNEHGWVNNGFEELLNWQETPNRIPPDKWTFNLWLQIKTNKPNP